MYFVLYAGTALVAVCILGIVISFNPIGIAIFLLLVIKFFKWLIFR